MDLEAAQREGETTAQTYPSNGIHDGTYYPDGIPPAGEGQQPEEGDIEMRNFEEQETPVSQSSERDGTTQTKDNGEGMERTDTNASIAQTLSPSREIMFVAVICLAQFMTQVGLGQTLSIIHIIGNSFGLSNPGELSWLIAGYSLTVGTFILVAGRLGDLFGYKRMLIIGFSWFSLWSMVAGLAVYSNHVLFVFARVFQGIGPAMCLPNGLAILGATYAPGPRKDMVFALFGACAPGGSIVRSYCYASCLPPRSC